MDIAAYAQTAVDLVNARLGSDDDLRAYLAPRSWLTERVRAGDLAEIQEFRARLGEMADASAAGDGPAAVASLNELLVKHPIRPVISGHDESSWHLHVHDKTGSVVETVCAEACFGLAMLVAEHGPTRIGRCAATDCDNAFIDTSVNRSRRFCSTRCSTRMNVAALRRRKQAAKLAAGQTD
ncbi:CGNR zinc finger domain-containing protein [Kineosporia sp. J2-2]|uniref:CGNR zinc finger domain-containing protein n=1 Tax=Kineosporia corallincola TaxID=2835133 RepID=A0ABS5TDQ2_9ACTN|nr:CGNR zinc finger domain-containing protein [Kineosporia corallincola]MBT0769220.1 CGNR zinc finger domain-containing protein [Kineosporia corallincola]